MFHERFHSNGPHHQDTTIPFYIVNEQSLTWQNRGLFIRLADAHFRKSDDYSSYTRNNKPGQYHKKVEAVRPSDYRWALLEATLQEGGGLRFPALFRLGIVDIDPTQMLALALMRQSNATDNTFARDTEPILDMYLTGCRWTAANNSNDPALKDFALKTLQRLEKGAALMLNHSTAQYKDWALQLKSA